MFVFVLKCLKREKTKIIMSLANHKSKRIYYVLNINKTAGSLDLSMKFKTKDFLTSPEPARLKRLHERVGSFKRVNPLLSSGLAR